MWATRAIGRRRDRYLGMLRTEALFDERDDVFAGGKICLYAPSRRRTHNGPRLSAGLKLEQHIRQRHIILVTHIADQHSRNIPGLGRVAVHIDLDGIGVLRVQSSKLRAPLYTNQGSN